MKKRCGWAPEDNPLLRDYHDEEWGIPVHEDRKHFEFLVLEGAQAGLSWLTILKRRQGYRQAFALYDVTKVAAFGEEEFNQLVLNPEIIRNRAKIKSAINNAKAFIKVQEEFGSFDKYIWQFVKGKTIQHQIKELADYPVTIPEAEELSRDLKKRGFSFVGPTVIYAHMQACGLVNDHMTSCFRYQKSEG